MKSIARFSGWVVLTGALCFAPCALGQGGLRHPSSAGSSFLNHTPASFLAFVFGPGTPHGHGDDDGGSCGNQGGGGWGGNGWGGGGWGGGGWGGGGWSGSGNGGGCTAMPEGGTALMYLSIAGLCFGGALILRSRRPTGVSRAN